ncbi:MAG: hypothetical protein ACYTFZ_04740 [Planctomycetota bacterium]|jgi:hypothetical protein
MDWYREVQFLAAVPMPVEWAREYGTTVNGMWDSPARWDRARVADAHAEGRRVLASVPLIALTASVYEQEENHYLVSEACRDIFGNRAEVKWYYWDPKPVYSMCLYSEVFRDYLLAKCRSAASAGVDVLNVDEINTSIGLMSREPGGSGFCPRCLEKFCMHLEDDDELRARAGIADVAELRKQDYSAMLARLRGDDTLYREYGAYHEEAAFATVREFLDRIRSAAAEEAGGDRQMAITANLAGLGTFLETQGRLWGATWGELIDFVMMENVYLIDPGEFHAGHQHKLLPRGKFTSWYRLASSFRSKAPAWLCPQIYVPQQLAGKKSVNYYLLMFLESYANNGRWGYYWWPGVDDHTRLDATVPEAVKDYTRFIVDHRRYYEGCGTENEIAVLYANSAILANPKSHFRYIALGQALAEAGYQYDVIYGGDDVFTPSRMDADGLKRYRAVLVPEAGGLTEQQLEALKAYADGGGRVIAYSKIALDGVPGVTAITDDPLLEFWREYRDRDRSRILSPLDEFEETRIQTSDRHVNVVRYQKEGQIICHVLNYDYREPDDTIAPKRDVQVRLPWKGNVPARARCLTLDGEQELALGRDGGCLTFTVPSVDPYALIVVA